MPRPSSIKRLPPAIRSAVDDALKRGCTIDAIKDLLDGLGQDVSRSAVGRYTKQYSELAAQQRDLKAVAETFGREFGEDNDPQVRLLIQMMTSMTTRAVMPIASGAEIDISGKEIGFFARSLKDIVSAARIDLDRETRIREEAEKRARREAADAADAVVRKAGASAETVSNVRKAILGLS